MKFFYVVKDAAGKTTSMPTEALDEASLVSQLQKQGYFIISIKPFDPSLAQEKDDKLKSKRTYTHYKAKLDDLLIFCHQMSTMLDAGVNLLRSLQIIQLQVESRQLAEVLRAVIKDVEQGGSFSTSLGKHPKIFNPFWVSLMEVGEASGTMPIVLEKLATYLEQEAAFRSSIVSAVIYPVILAFVASGAVIFFALFVGPKFKSLFDQFNVKLPLITLILLTIFDFIKTNFLLILVALSVILVSVWRYGKTKHGRQQIENLLFALPVLGPIYKTIVVEKFTSQMAILVDSGVPILYALDITQRLIGNLTCEKVVGDIKNSVREGKLIADPMSKSGFFPPMCVQMIMIGEETGELAKMLKRVSGFYQSAVQTFMKRFGTIFEPFMLIFMGTVIGTIVIAMFLPIFSISQLAGGGIKQ